MKRSSESLSDRKIARILCADTAPVAFMATVHWTCALSAEAAVSK